MIFLQIYKNSKIFKAPFQQTLPQDLLNFKTSLFIILSSFLDTAHFYVNLKMGIKTGQPWWLNAIVLSGAKKSKNASFSANVTSV
ncbi:hypothetical protein M452_0201800 [Staphylococcus epidermidis APO35]|nr:hypothetical protein M462_0203640 [Staphylococcus epidermidis CIM28]ESR27842.1 hypothetical protein M452_0201800 [Staphylococcus epidermidis APO35]ESU04574.1 hypothetical protein M461_0202705 [Staphylococcus epidermidis CIM37]ESV10604.1 hypothetical protein M456_0203120 [Staphylococcus epidermidis MC28]ESV15746.1 hypothetical protein M463_0204305 [Staphylococcus epidermidis WI05]ESV20831.1 hypothetical protein M464_0201450 [Staphylococcus epidermidis WI09]ESV25074.1 hypothetical protein M4